MLSSDERVGPFQGFFTPHKKLQKGSPRRHGAIPALPPSPTPFAAFGGRRRHRPAGRAAVAVRDLTEADQLASPLSLFH